MSALRRAPLLLALVAASLALAAAWLPFDNPGIRGTSRGGVYQCPAPWDTVLNEVSNRPNGEEPPDADQIEARCTEAGRHRFFLATGLGVGAGLATVATGGLAVIGRLRTRRDVEEREKASS